MELTQQVPPGPPTKRIATIPKRKNSFSSRTFREWRLEGTRIMRCEMESKSFDSLF